MNKQSPYYHDIMVLLVLTVVQTIFFGFMELLIMRERSLLAHDHLGWAVVLATFGMTLCILDIAWLVGSLIRSYRSLDD